MVSFGFRTSLTDHSFGEPEQDANTALTELDKGLRSVRIGEQCEAIVRFPRLFEKYPFPILINSALLKLAEVFRIGTNFPRLCVLRVCQQSEKHLDKILNVDEFVKRIFTVIHENDPIARSLALRTLGSIAVIISERKSIHHSIRDRMDSHDLVELEAAIYAASKFAAQSRTFAVNMCSKIADMIQGLATPASIKLKLIPILQYMYHDAHTAAMVRRLCTDLLPSYPSQCFVVVTLHTLTLLAKETLVEIPQQLLLLLDYLNDSRFGIQNQVLSDLKILADKGAHLWTTSNVESLVDFLLNTSRLQLQRKALDVLVLLAQAQATTCFSMKPDSKLHFLWGKCCYSHNTLVSAKGVQLLVQLASLWSRQENVMAASIPDLFQEAALAVESLVITLSCSGEAEEKQLKIALASAVQLSRISSDVNIAIVDSLAKMLIHANGTTLVLLCESLAAIGDMEPSIVVPTLVDIMSLLNRLSGTNSKETQAIVVLCTLMFQTHVSHSWSKNAIEIIEQASQKVNLWAAYKIARSAARYGHHKISNEIITRLLGNVSPEHLHFWLQGLRDFTLAESYLSNAVTDSNSSSVDRIVTASKLYVQGLSALKAASNPTQNLQFQSDFARMRVEFLCACSQLAQACKTLQTAPPPAIAHAVAAATRDELQRCGRITQQLRKCVKELKQVADAISKLYQCSFDADSDSLTNLQMQQQMASLLAEIVEVTCLRSAQQGTMADEDVSTISLLKHEPHWRISIRSMAQRCMEAATLAERFKEQHPDLRLINNLNIQCLMDCLTIILETPLCYPRFFFQTLQTTTIKLEVNPQPRVTGEPITTTIGAQLAIKVEGVVQLSSQQTHCRRVKAVHVTITCQQNANALRPDGKPLDTGICLTKSVEPHNDYFSAQFLLSFSTAGLHQVFVDTALLDWNDALWNAGPKTQLSVKTFEESGASKSTSSASAARAAATASTAPRT